MAFYIHVNPGIVAWSVRCRIFTQGNKLPCNENPGTSHLSEGCKWCPFWGFIHNFKLTTYSCTTVCCHQWVRQGCSARQRQSRRHQLPLTSCESVPRLILRSQCLGADSQLSMYPMFGSRPMCRRRMVVVPDARLSRAPVYAEWVSWCLLFPSRCKKKILNCQVALIPQMST